jgi:hypothetical protein
LAVVGPSIPQGERPAAAGPLLLKTVGDARWDLAAAELAWAQVR